MIILQLLGIGNLIIWAHFAVWAATVVLVGGSSTPIIRMVTLRGLLYFGASVITVILFITAFVLGTTTAFNDLYRGGVALCVVGGFVLLRQIEHSSKFFKAYHAQRKSGLTRDQVLFVMHKAAQLPPAHVAAAMLEEQTKQNVTVRSTPPK